MATGKVDQTLPRMGRSDQRTPHVTIGPNLPILGDILFASSDDLGTPGRLNNAVLNSSGYSPEALKQLPLFRDGFGILQEQNKQTIVIVVTVSRDMSSGEALSRNLKRAFDALSGIKSDKPRKSVWLPLMGTGDGGLSLAESFEKTLQALEQMAPSWRPFVSSLKISCADGVPQNEIKLMVARATEILGPYHVLVTEPLYRPSEPSTDRLMDNGAPAAPLASTQNRRFRDDTRTLNDITTGKLGLGFDVIAQKVVAVVHDAISVSSEKDTSDTRALLSAASEARLTIGLLAPWGAGKSTLVRALRFQFHQANHLTIVVNPWKWDGKGDIHDYVGSNVLKQFAEQRSGNLFLFRSFRFWRVYKSRIWLTIALFAALGIAAHWLWPDNKCATEKECVQDIVTLIASSLGLGGAFFWIVPKVSEHIVGQAINLVKTKIFGDGPRLVGADGLSQAYQDIASLLYQDEKGARPFVFFFDDLDRCSPERVATVLDSVHSLTAAGCVVFLAFDKEYIVAALNAHFEKIAAAYDEKVNFGRRFLEKIVQIEFRLPLVKSIDLHELGLIAANGTSVPEAPSPGASIQPDGETSNATTMLDQNSTTSPLPGPGQSRKNSDEPVPEIRLKQIIGDLLDVAVEPIGLNIRQAKSISNTLKLYLSIAQCSTESEARMLAAFIFADRFDPEWLDSTFYDIAPNSSAIASSSDLAEFLSTAIGEDKNAMLQHYHLIGRRPKKPIHGPISQA